MGEAGWLHVFRQVLVYADSAALLYFLALNSFYAFLLIVSIPELWRHWQVSEDAVLQRLIASDVLPPVSILVPAYNEEMTIGASVLSFLSLKYPRLEVILVNDGSRDRTVDVLIEQFDLYQVPPAYRRNIETKKLRAVYRSRTHSRLIVIDKDNGGKADSLNAALNAARHPFVLAVDADTLIEPDALLRLARPFVLGTSVAAVGGTIRVVNECVVEMGRVVETRVSSHWLAGCQTVEYLRAFLFGRLAWNRLGGNLVISGAFGLFRRKYMLAIGGYRTGNVTEDMDLAVRMHRYLHENNIKAEMPFIPDPVAWTEVPSNLGVLARQRERWHRGLIGTMLAHRKMLFNPRYGMTGMIAMPFFVFGELLAPIVELMGYVLTVVGFLFGAISWQFGLLFFAVAVGYGTILSLWAVVLEEVSFRRYKRHSDALRLLLFAFIEGIGFRQMTVWFRLQAFWKYFRGVESWGAMTRKGFAAKTGK